jgi:hypothetical protein
MNNDLNFYNDLPSVHRLTDITNPRIYQDVPDDWFIALTDVQGSTKAIQEGRYKEVNAVAAASITALLNAMPLGVNVPFVFGGDGATMVVPPSLVERARDALLGTQRLAKDMFMFNLRVGVVPVKDVLARDFNVRVAKLSFSENFDQAVFTGGGLAFADKLIKEPATSPLYLLKDDGRPLNPDFSGYECRWSQIPSSYDENISLLIMATGRSTEENSDIYHEVIHKIEAIYGDSTQRNPISVANMTPQTNVSLFGVETRIRQNTSAFLARLRLFFWTWGGYFLWRYRDNIWEKYKEVVTAATDREKFDDVLRMLMSGTVLQRDELTLYLDEQLRVGRLVYGVHVSRHALMTCLVFDRFGKQVHFVDGANGGYALAAKQLKQQLADRAGS